MTDASPSQAADERTSVAVDPRSTALVVVDMQNDFCHARGYYGKAGAGIADFQSVIEPVARMVETARSHAIPVIFTRLTYALPRGAMEQRHTIKPRRWSTGGKRLEPETWGVAVVDQMSPQPGDLLIDKEGYSAFEGTALEETLHARGIKTLMIVGVVSYACVLATAFSAFDKDFDVILVTDAIASWNGRLQRETGDIVDLLLGAAVPMMEIRFVG